MEGLGDLPNIRHAKWIHPSEVFFWAIQATNPFWRSMDGERSPSCPKPWYGSSFTTIRWSSGTLTRLKPWLNPLEDSSKWTSSPPPSLESRHHQLLPLPFRHHFLIRQNPLKFTSPPHRHHNPLHQIELLQVDLQASDGLSQFSQFSSDYRPISLCNVFSQSS